MFQQSVQSLAQTRAIGQAKDAVDAIHSSTLDDQQKIEALKNLGNQFAFNAASTGMPMDKIQGLMGAIAPPERLYQTPEEALVNAKPGSRAYEAGLSTFNSQQALKLQVEREQQAGATNRTQIMADAAYGKLNQKRADNQLKALDSDITNFTKQPDIKPLLEAREKMADIQGMSDSDLGTTMLGYSTMRRIYAKFIHGGGRLTEQDVKGLVNDPSLITNVLRYWNQDIYGKPIPEDPKVLRAAADALAAVNERRLKGAAGDYASSKEGIYDTIPKNALHDRLYKRLGFSDTAPAPTPASFSGAPSPGTPGMPAPSPGPMPAAAPTPGSFNIDAFIKYPH